MAGCGILRNFVGLNSGAGLGLLRWLQVELAQVGRVSEQVSKCEIWFYSMWVFMMNFHANDELSF